MKRFWVGLMISILAVVGSAGSALASAESDFASAVVVLFRAAQMGRTIIVQDGQGQDFRIIKLKELTIGLQGRQWAFELPTYVWQTDMNRVRIDGVPLKTILQAAAQGESSGLPKKDAEFFLDVMKVLKASRQGKAVRVDVDSTTHTMTQLEKLKVGIVDGQWRLELPRYVWQQDFSKISIDGEPLRQGAAALRCEGLFKVQ
ncbi:MAG: hypothetical protein JNJ49_11550 [Bdellovibrionaceae bacterium]|nr:hypothetical protein [Pseudobdellovibrionaceae bacterium]